MFYIIANHNKTLPYNVVNCYYNMVCIIKSTLSALTLNKNTFYFTSVKTPAAMFPFELRPLSVRKSAGLWVMVLHTVLWTDKTVALHTTQTTNTTMAQ